MQTTHYRSMSAHHAARGMPRRREAATTLMPESTSIYSGCYAISAREVAAVRVGTGRGARHEIILRSGVRLPVPYAQATHLADKIWDGVWADGTSPRRRKANPGLASGSSSRSTSSSRGKSATLRQAISQTLTKGGKHHAER